MNALSLILIVLVVSLTLVGCAENQGQDNDQEDDQALEKDLSLGLDEIEQDLSELDELEQTSE